MTGSRSIPTLDTVHGQLEGMACATLPDGTPAFLFRGERSIYPNTYSSMDRHYHGLPFGSQEYEQLDDVTAYAMAKAFPERRLRPRLTGAYAQHYGLPTQVFDFTASPKVVVFFASNRSYHANRAKVGQIGVLDVQKARDSGVCELFDLRSFSEALRARRQAAFGMIYSGFVMDDHTDLKRTDLAEAIGLQWVEFAHLPDDETYLYLINADDSLLSTTGDSFAGIAQELVDQFVETRGPLCLQAAQILAAEVPPIGRSRDQNVHRWTSDNAEPGVAADGGA